MFESFVSDMKPSFYGQDMNQPNIFVENTLFLIPIGSLGPSLQIQNTQVVGNDFCQHHTKYTLFACKAFFLLAKIAPM